MSSNKITRSGVLRNNATSSGMSIDNIQQNVVYSQSDIETIKSNIKSFEKFIDKLYNCGIQELKIIENFEIQESEEFNINEDENTISILNRYIDESEFDYNKTIIKGILQDIYKQASEVE